MYCSQCGQKIDDNSKYCSYCGYKIEKAPIAERNPLHKEPIRETLAIDYNRLKQAGEAVSATPDDDNLNSFLFVIQSISMQIDNSNCSQFLKKKHQMQVCIFARSIANYMYHQNKNIDYAYKIVCTLLQYFSDNSEIKDKLTFDKGQLETIKERNSQAYKEKQEAAKRRKAIHQWIVGIATVIGLVAIIYSMANDSKKPPTTKSYTTSSNNTQTIKPTTSPSPVYVYNGKELIISDYEELCPLSVTADYGNDYYIYLKYQYAPSKSTQQRQKKSSARTPYENDIAFFVKSGNTASIHVPIGVYKLYYATGKTFYGTKIVFGDNTSYYSSNELLDFYSDSSYYQGHDITLKTVYNGNFDTKPINEVLFPKR